MVKHNAFSPILVMKQTHTRSRRGLYVTILGIFLAFFVTFATAFPQYASFVPAKLQAGDFRLGLDLKGGAHLVYEADMSQIPDADRTAAIEGVRDVIERRVNAFGVSEPVVLTNVSGGHYQVIVELAGVTDVSAAVKQIGETPILEFKTPNQNPNVTPSADDETKAKDAQVQERKDALAVLDQAVNGGDFSALAKQYSIDTQTKDNNGYVGVVTKDDAVYGELAGQIKTKRLEPGVVDGLYESGSTMHIVNYLGRKDSQEVELSHILVCYAGATKCQSTRTQDEALTIINDLASQATTKNFAELAKAHSEDGSAQDGGTLGWVKEGDMVQPFQDAYLALEDGKISSVVQTEFGYHLIYRQDSRTVPGYEIAHIEMPWTTATDLVIVDPWTNTELSGKDVKHAAVGFDPNTNAPLVQLTFNDNGAELFGKLTEANVNNVIGIFLDGSPISTPVVRQAIYGGQATITGNFSLQEAKLLAQRLNAGALPVPVNLVSQQTIGPSLGQASLDASIKAALIGFALVGLFMMAYYRLPGVLAVLTMFFYTTINLALYKWLNVTMSLSGIAGFVLSIGIAMDANVLIFERMKEELRSGRDLPTAIDEGFRRAWTSIRDGNMTTVIASSVLFVMSTSFVKGFALTLIIGVLISLLCAMFVSRVLLQFVSGWKLFQKPWLYNGAVSKKE